MCLFQDKMSGCFAVFVFGGVVRAGVYEQFYNVRMAVTAGFVKGCGAWPG